MEQPSEHIAITTKLSQTKCLVIPFQSSQATYKSSEKLKQNQLTDPNQISGVYRIFDMRNNQIIDGSFSEGHSDNATIYKRRTLLKKASVRLITNPKTLTQKSQITKNKLQNHDDQQFKIQLIRAEVDISGKEVEQYDYLTSNLVFTGEYKQGLRDGFGKFTVNRLRVVDNKIEDAIEYWSGFWNRGLKDGYFLITLKLKVPDLESNVKQFTFGRYQHCTKKGIFFYCSLIYHYEYQQNQDQKNTDVNDEKDHTFNICPIGTQEELNESLLIKQQELQKQKQKCQKQAQTDKSELELSESRKDYIITEYNLSDITQDTMLSNQVCNAYGNYLFRSQFQVKSDRLTFIADLNLMDILSSGRANKIKDYKLYGSAKVYTRPLNQSFNIFSGRWQRVLFPFSYYHKTHFVLYSLEIQISLPQKPKMVLRYYDSLGNEQAGNDNSKLIKLFLIQYLNDKQNLIFPDTSNREERQKQLRKQIQSMKVKVQKFNQIPEQYDSYSCGVFMCYFMECLTKNQSIDRYFDPKQYRKKIKQSVKLV